MDTPVAHDVFLFGGFRLDRHSGGLFRQDGAGSATPVAIGARALDVLAVLVAHQGELVSKQAIMQAVWPGMTVDEKNLAVQISALRRVLDDGQPEPSCIQTEAGRGYRFVAPVTRPSHEDGPAAVVGRGCSGLGGFRASTGVAADIPRLTSVVGFGQDLPWPCWCWRSGWARRGTSRADHSWSSRLPRARRNRRPRTRRRRRRRRSPALAGRAAVPGHGR